MKKIILLFSLVLSYSSILAQSGGSPTCADAAPLCASEEFEYVNTSDESSAENGPNYGCLSSQPNPGWFYLQIGETGPIELLIEQSSNSGGAPNLDVDFIIWGPFSDLTNACDNLTASNTIDCSYSAAPTETVSIPNAQTGEFYILLITNFNGDAGYISVEQTNESDSNSGSTNCDIVIGNAYYECEDDGNESEEWDLNEIMLDVVNGDASIPTSAHLNLEDAENNQNAVASPYTNTSNPTILYIREEDSSGAYTITEIQLIVGTIPELIPHTLYECDNDEDNSEEFNLESALANMIASQTGLSFTFHPSEAEAEANTNSFTSTNYTVFAQTTTVYVRATNSITGCYKVQPLILELDEGPQAQDATLLVCVSPGETSATFDLTMANGLVTTAANTIVTYHPIEAFANNAVGGLQNPYTTSNNGEIVWVRVENQNSGCYNVVQLTLNFGEGITNVQNANLELCDDDTDGFVSFDLTQANVYTGAENVTINYYETLALANANDTATALGTTYTNTSNPQTIYAAVAGSSGCAVTVEIVLIVNENPNLNLDSEYVICIDQDGDPMNNDGTGLTLDAGSGFSTYLWSGTSIEGATTQTVEITQGGTYTVTVSNTSECTDEHTFTVSESSEPLIQSVDANINSLTINATGLGNYEYSLNGTDWQMSNTFNNMSPGVYTVYVRDTLGCGIATIERSIIGIPNIFTPNGDGYNDTWTIQYADAFDGAQIRVFDRYGKELISGPVNGFRWNGKYQSKPVPTTDYWYIITFVDGTQVKGNISLFRRK